MQEDIMQMSQQLERAKTVACKPFYPPQLIIQDELHLITGPLGTIYGGYETVVEEMCCIEKNGRKKFDLSILFQQQLLEMLGNRLSSFLWEK